MLKAIFLDLDETLCDTPGANRKALADMAAKADEIFPNPGDPNFSADLTERYLRGMYRKLDERYSRLLLPIKDEASYRTALIELILNDLGVGVVGGGGSNVRPLGCAAATLQRTFDEARMRHFDFYPSIKQLLRDLRRHFTLVVITNGPTFSQVGKVEAVRLAEYVDHVIIGGQEKEEKPAPSIFHKAMRLAGCERHEAMMVGDNLTADVGGANGVGIESVWISHGRELNESLGIAPTHVVEDPFQLRPLLERLTGFHDLDSRGTDGRGILED